MEVRDNYVFLIIGDRGTGKTDFIKEQIILPSLHSKKLVVDTFDSPRWHDMETFQTPANKLVSVTVMPPNQIPFWKSGFYRTFTSDMKRIFKLISENVWNALIVFEDATKYLEGKLDDDVNQFLIDSKQKNLDVVLTFHAVSDVPPKLFKRCNYIVFFKTGDNLQDIKKVKRAAAKEAWQKAQNHKSRYAYSILRVN